MHCPKLTWVLMAALIGACYSVSFWYFAHGFLLTRVELVERATGAATASARPAPFKKAVVVVLDALRFDFLWSSVSGTPSASEHHYSGRLTAFAEAARDPHARTWFYEAVADAPTTTMQRLKALATGGLPTFVDIGSNFNSAALEEDTWVAQAHAAGLNLTFMGDDTWISLFPHTFDTEYPYPSFDVMDLHTVDAGVTKHLVPELRSGRSDVVVAHFLGVDHVGHRHGADHPAMAAKLGQLNAVMRTVLQELPQDTLLLVLGDHGMTEDGNHGGATPAEVNAGLLLHYKAPHAPVEAKKAVVQAAAALSGMPVTHRTPLADARTVNQIDLVPTLALALGIRVPFSNLGMVLPEPFLDRTQSNTAHEELAHAARANVAQISKYLHAYAKRVPSFADSIGLAELDALARRAQASGTAPDDELQQLYAFYRRVAEGCRKLWASLDRAQMCWGAVLALLASALLVVAVLATNRGIIEFPWSGVATGAALGVAYSFVIAKWNLPVIGNFAPIPACVALGTAICATVEVTATLRENYPASARTNWHTALALVVAVLHALCMLSNSYEEAEDAVVRYAVSSLAVVVVCASALGKSSVGNLRVLSGGTWRKVVLLLLVVRASELLAAHGQRIERTSSVRSVLGDSLSFVSLAAISWLAKNYLWDAPRLRDPMRVPRKLVDVALALVGAFWMLKRTTLPPQASERVVHVVGWAKLLLPHAVWALAGVAVLWVVVSGFRLTRLVRRDDGRLVLIMPVGHGALVASLTAPVLMVMGSHAALPVALMFVQIVLLGDLVKKLEYRGSVLGGVLMALTGIQYFYATGHTPQISDIAFDAAFVGFEKTNWVVGFVLVLLNTVGAPLLCLLSVPLLCPQMRHFELRRWWLFVAYLSYFAVHALALAATTTFIFLEPRHLMIWRVFSPRLLFDAGMTAFYFVVAAAALAFSSLECLRW